MERMIQNVLLTVIAVLLLVITTSRDTEAQRPSTGNESSGKYHIINLTQRGGGLRLNIETGEVAYCDDNRCSILPIGPKR